MFKSHKTSPFSKTYDQIGEIDFYPKRQRNIYLAVKNNRIRVSYPYQAFAQAEKFIKSKTSLIKKLKSQIQAYKTGMQVGTNYSLNLDSDIKRPMIKDNIIYSPNQIAVIEKIIKQALKIEAEEKLLPLVERLISETKLRPTRINFRYMTSRWGSCSHQGRLSLNSALIYLPNNLAEYVIIHELCHLKVLNHSNKFWQLVKIHSPNYLSLKTKLRQYKPKLIAEDI